MSKPCLDLPAIFTDRHGSERIVFRTTGSWLTTKIRGVVFEGADFDALSTEAGTDQFDAHEGCLCGCSIVVTIPVRLGVPGGMRLVDIQAEILLGNPGARGGLDVEKVRLTLKLPEIEGSAAVSQGDSGWFEDEMLSLVGQLPVGYELQTCFTCGLSDYSPGGHSLFGSLACFRDVAEEYRRVGSKGELFAIWGRKTELVQETHRCRHYEPRPPGRGYRG